MGFQSPWVLEHVQGVTTLQWFIVTLVGFLLLVWVWVRYIWPSMVAQHLEEHQRRVAEAIQEVDHALAEMDRLRDDYRSRLDRIEEETQRRMAEAVAEAEALREQIIAEGRASADAIVARGRQEVERERAKARVRLRGMFVDLVINAARAAAPDALDGTDHRRLIDRFIHDVGGAH
ncbi:MAG: F0F1 ATP synthase subunit B [Chthonomonadales bacterium]